MNPEDEIYRHILLASKKFDDADSELPIYFKTTEEMLQECAYLGSEKAMEVVVTNPNRIADMVEDIQLLPKGQLFPPRLENSREGSLQSGVGARPMNCMASSCRRSFRIVWIQK